MKYRSHKEPETPFPLAPMIDLTFLLLIFFMVTSRLSQDPIQEAIPLPLANTGRIPPDVTHREIIEIGREGKVRIAKKLVDRQGLENYLRTRNLPHRKVYLRAAGETPAQKIKEVISIATEAGVTQIFLGVHHR